MAQSPTPHQLTLAIRRTLTLLATCSAICVPAIAAAQDDASEPTSLGELVVSATALKVEAPLMETPRPGSVVEQEELEERNVQTLDETFRYRAGVLSGQYGEDNDTDWLKIRGFDQSTYQDGLRIYRQGFYQWLPEPFGLDRIELLKGPASILYGEAPPGGVINAISKRPTDTVQGQINLQAGTDEHRQLGVDTSGPVGDRNDLSYRLVGLYRYNEGDLDFTENERYYLAPSLTWEMSDSTELTLLASIQKDDAIPTNPFKLPFGTIDDTPFGKVDPSTNYSEPGYDTNERTQSAIGYSLSHRLNDTWTFEQDFRYSQVDLLLRSSFIFFQTGPREGQRYLVYRDGEINSWTIDNRLVGKWFTDRTEHTLLFGVDYQDLENKGKQNRRINIALVENGTPSAGIVYAPAIGRMFVGDLSSGAYEIDPAGTSRKIAVRACGDNMTAIASRSHLTKETEDFISQNKISDCVNAGSSLKFCLVAAGEADIYPRFGPTMEWDTAAGHAVLLAAGGRVLTCDGSPLSYGKTQFRNPYFIAASPTAHYSIPTTVQAI